MTKCLCHGCTIKPNDGDDIFIDSLLKYRFIKIEYISEKPQEELDMFSFLPIILIFIMT